MAQTALKQLTAEVINEFVNTLTAETLARKVQCPGCKSKFSEAYCLTVHLKKHGATKHSLKTLFKMRAARIKAGSANEIAAVVNVFSEFDYVLPLMGGNKKVVFCRLCSKLISKRHVKQHLTKTSSHADEHICCDGWKCCKDGNVLRNRSASVHRYSTFEHAYELIHGGTHSDPVICSGDNVRNIPETRDQYEGAGASRGNGIDSEDPELNAATETIFGIYDSEDTDVEVDRNYMSGFREFIQTQNVKSLKRYDDTPIPARPDLEEELKHFKYAKRFPYKCEFAVTQSGIRTWPIFLPGFKDTTANPVRGGAVANANMRDTTQANIGKLFGSCEKGRRRRAAILGGFLSSVKIKENKNTCTSAYFWSKEEYVALLEKYDSDYSMYSKATPNSVWFKGAIIALKAGRQPKLNAKATRGAARQIVVKFIEWSSTRHGLRVFADNA